MEKLLEYNCISKKEFITLQFKIIKFQNACYLHKKQEWIIKNNPNELFCNQNIEMNKILISFLIVMRIFTNLQFEDYYRMIIIMKNDLLIDDFFYGDDQMKNNILLYVFVNYLSYNNIYHFDVSIISKLNHINSSMIDSNDYKKCFICDENRNIHTSIENKVTFSKKINYEKKRISSLFNDKDEELSISDVNNHSFYEHLFFIIYSSYHSKNTREYMKCITFFLLKNTKYVDIHILFFMIKNAKYKFIPMILPYIKDINQKSNNIDSYALEYYLSDTLTPKYEIILSFIKYGSILHPSWLHNIYNNDNLKITRFDKIKLLIYYKSISIDNYIELFTLFLNNEETYTPKIKRVIHMPGY